MSVGASRAPSLYITGDGYQRLRDEYQALWKRRAAVTRALAAAAAEGDRSENAEYIYRKKELREIDRRIRYLQKRLPQLKVVTAPPSDLKRVFFGAWVTLEDDVGQETVYRIVGPDEFDPAKGWISVDSPVARALISKTVDEDVLVNTPRGAIRYCIVAIQYAVP
jgi:transcription elongation factor GreB